MKNKRAACERVGIDSRLHRLGASTTEEELLELIAELNNDDKGLVWPESVTPFDVQVVAAGRDAVAFDVASTLSDELEAAGLDVLYDDRPKVSPGVKFKDAELLGMPTIVTVGRGLAEGVIEVRDRATGERAEVPVAEAAAAVLAAVRG